MPMLATGLPRRPDDGRRHADDTPVDLVELAGVGITDGEALGAQRVQEAVQDRGSSHKRMRFVLYVVQTCAQRTESS